MSVHEAITRHSLNQQRHLDAFSRLDELREQQIEWAIAKCRNQESFSVEVINQLTRQINDHAKQGISPSRTLVTEQMVREYVLRLDAADHK